VKHEYFDTNYRPIPERLKDPLADHISETLRLYPQGVGDFVKLANTIKHEWPEVTQFHAYVVAYTAVYTANSLPI
jgi:hypothetical protein